MIMINYCNIPNFGDAMNPILLEKLLGEKCIYSNKYKADIIGIGSILTQLSRLDWRNKIKNIFANPSVVWTSGFIKEVEYKEEFRKNLRFAALRGKLSLERVEKIIGQRLDIPLGDGGLLFSKLLDKMPEKKYAIGIIPHTVDIKNPQIIKLSEELPKSVLIDVRQEPMKVLEQIASCDFIVSTAMHGLIAADSLGIPNKWIEVSDKVVGNGYKFRDYYSVFKDYKQQVYRINEQDNITQKQIQVWQDEYCLKLSEVESLVDRLYLALKNIRN